MTAAPLPHRPKTGAPLAQWDSVTIRYPYAARDAVGPVNLAIEPGERLLVLGPSGSGKSTLLQSLTGILQQTVPATVMGRIQIEGVDVSTRTPSEWSKQVAHFFQDADRTLTGLRVFDEVAFALENQALEPSEIKARVSETMALVGLAPSWNDRRTSTLSGGEKQLVALAATLVANAEIFVADEPTANLSPAVAKRVYDLVLSRDDKRAVLIIDHRLDQMISAIQRVVVLSDDGTVLAQGAPGPLFRNHGDQLDQLGIWTPLVSRFDRLLVKEGFGSREPLLTMGALANHLENLPQNKAHLVRPLIKAATAPHVREHKDRVGEGVAHLDGADCAPLLGPTVLRDITFELHAGEIIGIVGPNGAGKSTLGASLAGLLRLKGGKRQGKPGAIAFQNPENQFLEASVKDEIKASLTKNSASDEISAALKQWNLDHLAHQHPYELSQGEKRRLALACLTVSDRWPLLILDEPTSGLDARGTKIIAETIGKLADDGRAIALITHDMDFALAVCDRLIVVNQGRIFAEGSPSEILRDETILQRADLTPPSILPILEWLDKTPC